MIMTDMIAVYILAGALLLGALLYPLMLIGRRGNAGLAALRGFRYAHRGLHNESRPENSIAAFRAAKEAGFGIELDLHLMRDGTLAVIHDPSLKRTAGADVLIEDLTAAALDNYRLAGTQEKIPTFPEVLALYQGSAPLIVELKSERSNFAALTDAAVKALEDYPGAWCMESFDPRCVHYLKKHYPHIIRGQLTEDFLHNPKSKMPWIVKFCMTRQVFNFLTVPDFIAYKFADRKRLGMTVCRKLWGLQEVSWTLKSMEELEAAEQEGALPIFEGFVPK